MSEVSEASEVWVLYRNRGSRVQITFVCANDEDEIEGVKLGLEQTNCTIDDIVEVG